MRSRAAIEDRSGANQPFADTLDRLGARRLAQRIGVIGEPTHPLPSDPAEVRQLLLDPGFRENVERVAAETGDGGDEPFALAAGFLREMAASHHHSVSSAWQNLSEWALRAYDVTVEPEQIRKLRKLDRRHSLAVLFSHRSYLDGLIWTNTLIKNGISPPFEMGGSNLNFFPLGPLATRAGIVFIRRSIKSLPLYRLTLRSYIAQLISNRHNIGWSIEGGRTRTGKLRPPTYGVLRYVVDAAEVAEGPEVLLLPVSIVYDQLHEVAKMASEARGGHKTPEDAQWMLEFIMQQSKRLGHAYMEFAEPVPLRERLAELRGEDPTGSHAVERVALDVSHRINQVTPVTATAVASLAMLAGGRALSLDEVLSTVGPIAQYLQDRNWPIAGGFDMTDRSTVRRTLGELVSSGVLTAYDGGTETVWGIGRDQHLIAAFYRNTAIHVLVTKAIGELGVIAGIESDETSEFWHTTWKSALRLRDLFKFEFFFAGRRDFAANMARELDLHDGERDWFAESIDRDEARRLLAESKPLVAHLTLRPYLDAYHVVARQLAAWGNDDFDEEEFLTECLGVAKQWSMQRRIGSEESASYELFKTALRLADHRGLLTSDDPHLSKRRNDFAEEVRDAVRRVAVIADMARAQTRAAMVAREQTEGVG